MAVFRPGLTSLLLLLCISLGCLAQSPSCVFPEFMSARQHWESHISMERRMTDQYVEFTGSSMATREYTTDGDTVTTRECLQQVTPERLLVKVTTGDLTLGYQCLEFIRRSGSVAQVKHSPIAVQRSELLCEDSQMRLDPWPLVWPFVDSTDEYVPCSISGGYDITLYDHQSEQVVCEESNPKPRWESDCQGGEGTHIDFRFFDCQGGLSMDTSQDLYCLGTWTEGQYEFSVMSNNDELWPNLWLLRHPTYDPMAVSLEAILLADIVADPEESITLTSRVYTISMNRQVYASLCEDEAASCEECDDSMEFYCQKSCQKCDANKQIPRCQFYQVTKGEWLDVGMGATADVRVATSMLYVDDLLPFQCMQLHTEQWYQGTGRRALVTVFKNGCKPRYNCVEMLKRGWNILEYRLGQGVVWPYTNDLAAEDVCSDANFRNDPLPNGNRYRNAEKKFLVAAQPGNQRRTPMNCGINGRYNMEVSYRDEGSCTGTLDLCDTYEIGLSLNGCSGVPQLQTFICIGTIVTEADVYVMTEDKENPEEVRCWLFHKTEWMGKPSLILTKPSECHGETATRVVYRNATNYVAIMDFEREEVDVMEEDCSELSDTTTIDTSTTTTTPTTTASPTSTTTTTLPTTTSPTTTTREPTPITEPTTTTVPTTTTEPTTTTITSTTTTTTTTTDPPTTTTTTVTTEAPTTSPRTTPFDLQQTTKERSPIVVNPRPRSGAADRVTGSGRYYWVMALVFALGVIL